MMVLMTMTLWEPLLKAIYKVFYDFDDDENDNAEVAHDDNASTVDLVGAFAQSNKVFELYSVLYHFPGTCYIIAKT